MMNPSRTWVFVNGRGVSSHVYLSSAVVARCPFVDAWLDERDLTLAQAAREIVIFARREGAES